MRSEVQDHPRKAKDVSASRSVSVRSFVRAPPRPAAATHRRRPHPFLFVRPSVSIPIASKADANSTHALARSLAGANVNEHLRWEKERGERARERRRWRAWEEEGRRERKDGRKDSAKEEMQSAFPWLVPVAAPWPRPPARSRHFNFIARTTSCHGTQLRTPRAQPLLAAGFLQK